ncbi:MAG: antitoxin Xre/MbcA/ParS toxin-binding domain-containing protein [Oleiphilaceae bacterium]|nr:antitoxin Xre/MbcA/ParS toxin-binding domain-containing protein [Oleiphilaceae bacterium]
MTDIDEQPPKHAPFRPDMEKIDARVRRSHKAGLDIPSVVRSKSSFALATRIQDTLGIDQDTLSRLLRMKRRTLDRRRQEDQLDEYETDRLYSVLSLYQEVLELTAGDDEAASRWLQRPLPALDNLKPIDVMDTETGIATLRDIVGRVQHGVFM